MTPSIQIVFLWPLTALTINKTVLNICQISFEPLNLLRILSVAQLRLIGLFQNIEKDIPGGEEGCTYYEQYCLQAGYYRIGEFIIFVLPFSSLNIKAVIGITCNTT